MSDESAPNTAGFYWYFDGARAPVVVEVTASGEVYFCGTELYEYLPGAGANKHVATGRFVGPLTAPAA